MHASRAGDIGAQLLLHAQLMQHACRALARLDVGVSKQLEQRRDTLEIHDVRPVTAFCDTICILRVYVYYVCVCVCVCVSEFGK